MDVHITMLSPFKKLYSKIITTNHYHSKLDSTAVSIYLQILRRQRCLVLTDEVFGKLCPIATHRVRAVMLDTGLQPYTDIADLFIVDPDGFIIRFSTSPSFYRHHDHCAQHYHQHLNCKRFTSLPILGNKHYHSKHEPFLFIWVAILVLIKPLL